MSTDRPERMRYAIPKRPNATEPVRHWEAYICECEWGQAKIVQESPDRVPCPYCRPDDFKREQAKP